MKMKPIKLDYRQMDAKNSPKRRLCSFNSNKMFKKENWTILLLLALAHEIQGIYSQGKKNFSLIYLNPIPIQSFLSLLQFEYITNFGVEFQKINENKRNCYFATALLGPRYIWFVQLYILNARCRERVLINRYTYNICGLSSDPIPLFVFRATITTTPNVALSDIHRLKLKVYFIATFVYAS